MSVFDRAYIVGVTGQSVKFDSVIDEKLTGTNKITSHAIEAGANIADHSENAGGGLTLKIVLSDDVQNPANPSSFFAVPMSVRLTILNELREKGVLITYFSPRKIVQSLLIASITESVSQAYGWGTAYDMQLQKVRLFGIVTRDTNLPTTALRLLKKGLVAGVTATVAGLLETDVL